ncbi:MAG: hypothetical protein Dasosvirus2_32 [Dasosvirus sp.]|uniref:Uncharacterized protein n=1 Tax=Dasosvirus sp. TaxID=2487764 RepID=A0A3G4ZRA4_9VIRU|nr:MAG: hypothetical protein Dasosvirus2_32 [Dasosvirus sp.]
MSSNLENSNAPEPDIKERIVRVLIFMIFVFLLIKYIVGVPSLTDQINIVLVSTVSLMFVNTFYPVVVTK